jgi:hypothetical protein
MRNEVDFTELLYIYSKMRQSKDFNSAVLSNNAPFYPVIRELQGNSNDLTVPTE